MREKETYSIKAFLASFFRAVSCNFSVGSWRAHLYSLPSEYSCSVDSHNSLSHAIVSGRSYLLPRARICQSDQHKEARGMKRRRRRRGRRRDDDYDDDGDSRAAISLPSRSRSRYHIPRINYCRRVIKWVIRGLIYTTLGGRLRGPQAALSKCLPDCLTAS